MSLSPYQFAHTQEEITQVDQRLLKESQAYLASLARIREALAQSEPASLRLSIVDTGVLMSVLNLATREFSAQEAYLQARLGEEGSTHV